MVSLCKGCKTGPCYQNIPGLPYFNAECSNENNRICLLSRTKGILTIMFTNTPHFQVYRLLGLNCFATVFTYRSGFMFSLYFKIRLLSSSHTEHLFINKLKLHVQVQEFLMWTIMSLLSDLVCWYRVSIVKWHFMLKHWRVVTLGSDTLFAQRKEL